MRIVRFAYHGRERWGVLEGKEIRVLAGPPFCAIRFARHIVRLEKARIVPPATPTKIVLVGLNYRDHAREMGMKTPKEPVIFLKPPTSLVAHGEPIVYPAGVSRLDYEAELALVIRRKAKGISAGEAGRFILGYTCLNDVTARDLQEKDGQWTRSKSFDTFCPLGPWLETELDPSNLRISTRVNGRVHQDSRTSNFIFPVPQLVSFISGIMTLLPGDVISTGTPPGVGAMKPSDIVEVEVEGVGILANRVSSPKRG